MRKNKLFLSLCGALLVAVSGCSVFKQPVPQSELKGQIGGQAFSLKNPKDTTLTNLVVEVGADGAAKLSLGYLSSSNSSNVINAATTGQADTINALGTQILNGINAGAAIAGKAAGAALK